jgi:hypothetical protein
MRNPMRHPMIYVSAPSRGGEIVRGARGRDGASYEASYVASYEASYKASYEASYEYLTWVWVRHIDATSDQI